MWSMLIVVVSLNEWRLQSCCPWRNEWECWDGEESSKSTWKVETLCDNCSCHSPVRPYLLWMVRRSFLYHLLCPPIFLLSLIINPHSTFTAPALIFLLYFWFLLLSSTCSKSLFQSSYLYARFWIWNMLCVLDKSIVLHPHHDVFFFWVSAAPQRKLPCET